MTFRVVYERDGSGWHAYIPSVKGCRTWGRSLRAARRYIREALSTCVHVFDDPDAVARSAVLIDEVRLPRLARRKLAEHAAHRRRAEAEATALRMATREAALALVKGVGLSLRDAGELLGLSQEGVRKVAS